MCVHVCVCVGMLMYMLTVYIARLSTYNSMWIDFSLYCLKMFHTLTK